jgi:3-mercaptopyruvate sulfurtransferase SseA
MIPMGYFFNSDRTWKSREQLRLLFEAQGIDLDREIVTYCGGNPLSACTFFTARYVMGLDGVKNYHGSITAWLEDPRNLPLDTYQYPNMLRDSDWIGWFAGDRIQRLLLDPPAIVVDVRDPASYDAAHIKWSVNLPMSPFDVPELEDREAWANRLGAIGVGAPIEAVICDEELSPRATALFYVLDFLGYDDLSVCVDGLEGWRADGYVFTDDETLIAEPDHRLDVAVHPKDFEPNPVFWRRTASFDTPPKQGFRRVWIVASEEVPAEFEDREHVHIPWRENFDDSGELLSAPELWSKYEEAGVTIFSDVAIYAPDWKHASVNYFALRLLGLRRVSIFVP